MRHAASIALWMALLAGPNSVASPVEVPPLQVDAADGELRRQGALQLWRGEPLSGWLVLRAGGQMRERTPYWQGRREGLAEAWHSNGQRAYARLYRGDKRTGVHRGWWPNGQLQFERRYVNDQFEGTQRAWFENGVLFEVGQFANGREEGRQSQYAEDGKLIANYVVRDGRRYGVVGRFDCTTVRGH